MSTNRPDTTAAARWNLPPGGDNADGPRASDGAITGIDGPDPDAPPPQRHADPQWAICPFCGYKHGDGWEWATRRTVTRCDGCDNMFTVDPEYSVTYHTFVAGDEAAFAERKSP